MGIDVPDGSAPEQPKEEAPAKSGVESSTQQNKKNLKGLIVLASLGVLTVAGLLIGLLPDWGDGNDVYSAVEEPDDSPPDFPPTTTEQFYESNEGPFKVRLPLFSANITGGYQSKDEVQNDLEQLARFLLNGAITSNFASGQRQPVAGDGFVDEDSAMDQGAAGAPEGGADNTAESAPALGAEGLEDTNDYETNNQEENVDRADLAKSNGELIFVAYGNYVVVVRAEDGEQIARIEIPSIELPPEFTQGEGFNQGGSPGVAVPEPGLVEEEPGIDMIDEPGVSSASSLPFFWNPKPHIDALLLEGDRLAVVASGYSMEHTMGAAMPPIFWDFQNTKVFLYDVNNFLYDVNGDDISHLPLTSTTLNGSFRNAFSKDSPTSNDGYVVTQAGINTWDYLLAPIQRWQERFDDLTDAGYLELATIVARDELIPAFVSALEEALEASGSIDLTRISLYAGAVSSDGASERSLFAGGIANAVTYVVSFDMAEETAVQGELTLDISELTLDISATFQPGNWGHVYAHEQMIIVADQGWTSEEDRSSSEYTYLLGFSLEGATSTHTVVGSVPGHILSPYSIDFVETEEGNSYIRVATTQNFWSPEGMFFIDEPIFIDEPMGDELNEAGEDSTGDSTVDNTAADGVEVTEVAADEVGVTEVAADEVEVTEVESSTLNKIFVLQFPAHNPESADPNNNELVQVGQAEMGKDNEVRRATSNGGDSLLDHSLFFVVGGISLN
jgi:hypothetical protein